MVPIYLERNSKRIRKANNDPQLKFTFTPPPGSWICGAKPLRGDVRSQGSFCPAQAAQRPWFHTDKCLSNLRAQSESSQG